MKVKLSMGTRVTDGRWRGKRRRIMDVGTRGTDGMGARRGRTTRVRQMPKSVPI